MICTSSQFYPSCKTYMHNMQNMQNNMHNMSSYVQYETPVIYMHNMHSPLCWCLAPSDSVGEHGPSSHLCAAWQRKLVSVLPACVMRSRDRTVEAPGDGCGALTEFESLAHLGLKSIHCECFSLVVSFPGPARCSRGGSLIAAQATPGPASGPGQDGRPITVVPLSWGCRPSWRESESCETQSVTRASRSTHYGRPTQLAGAAGRAGAIPSLQVAILTGSQ